MPSLHFFTPSKPVVTVIVPAYNTAEFIAETLDSVFAQTFKHFELILVNDGSPDTARLERVLEPYQGRISYIKQENRGLAGARNTGIRRAQGEYLAFLDSDDTWLPEYLAEQVKFMKRTPGLDVVYCDSHLFGDPRFAGRTQMQECPSVGPVTFESLLLERCQVNLSCTLARSAAVKDAGLFDESLRSVEDYDLWLRITYRGGKIGYHHAVLGRRRVRPSALSAASATMLACQVQVLRKLDDTLDLSSPMCSLLRQRLRRAEAFLELEQGKLFLARGQFWQAKKAFQRADGFFGSPKLRLALLGLRISPRAVRLAAKVWGLCLRFERLFRREK